MTNVETMRRGQPAFVLLLLSVVSLTLILAYAIPTVVALPLTSDGTLNEDEPRALLVGLRADRVPADGAPGRAALASDSGVRVTRPLFTARGLGTQSGVYHDPQLELPLSLAHIYRLDLAPGASAEETMARLRQRPEVAFVEPDYVAQQIATPNDPQFGQQWGLTRINAPAAWDVQTGGALVAVVDAGIDLDHPDLSEQLWINPGEIAGNGLDDDSNGYVDDVHGWNFYGDNDDLGDSTGHGTQVAGLVGATGNNSTGVAGVCWDCQLMVLKVIQPGGAANYSDIAAAIDYAVAKGADVVNLSLGGYSDSVALRAAVVSAAESAVLVGGAGNDDGDVPFYPAAYEGVLALAGTDDADVRVSSSNYGTWVDLSAPGSAVMTTFDGGSYGETAGTSLAAPFASGAAALLQGAHNWSPALVRAQLLQTAAPIDTVNPGYEGLLGSGRLDTGAALTTAPEPDLVVQTLTVDGRDGGYPEPGMTVDLHITMRNEWAPTGPLQATLSSSDPYVTVVENSTTFDAIDTYAMAQSDTPLRITVANSAPYGHELHLQLTMREGGAVVDTVSLALPVASQTIEVSGIIDSDTTWEGDRVYHLTGNTVVADGATLTVEAGAQVLVESGYVLRVQGELLGTGSEEAPVVFTSAADSPAAGDWIGIDVTDNGRVELVGCEVAYGGTGVSIDAWGQEHTIDNCAIHHNYSGVRSNGGELTIRNSRLLHNGYLATTGGGPGTTTIQDSEIAYNGGGIAEVENVLHNSIHHNQGWFDTAGGRGAGVFGGQRVYSNTVVMNTVGIAARFPIDLQHNNIDHNLSFNFWVMDEQSIALPDNWWGTTDLDAINNTIYDFEEDSNLGIVDVQPILTESSAAAPAYFYNVVVEPDTTVGLQEVTLDMAFSGVMDEGIAPEVLLKLEQWIDENDIPGWSNTYVNDMAVTSNGVVWLATNNGAIRYDGSQGNIHLQEHDISQVLVDVDGNVWAVTDLMELWRFDGEEWTSYTLGSVDDMAADPEGGVWLVQCWTLTHFDGATATEYWLDIDYCAQQVDVTADGTLWLGAYEHVYRFDGNQWIVYQPMEESGEEWWSVQDIAAVSANEIWIKVEQALLHLDGNEWTVHTPGDTIVYDFSNIEIANNGDVLLGSANSVFRYDGSKWAIAKSLSVAEGHESPSVYHIQDTGTGGLWLGTNEGAVQLYETAIEGGQWLDENTYQASHRVTSLMPRGSYDVEVSGAFDAEGNETPPVGRPAFSVDYAGEVADITPPPAPSLRVNGVDGDASAVTARWQASDSDSSIIAYRYAIGTNPGGRQIVNWTDTTDTEVTRSGFGLIEGEIYWFSVQAQNSGGLWSETTTRSFVAGETSFDMYLPTLLRQ